MIDRTIEIGRCSIWDRSCSLLRRTVPVAMILVSCVSAAEAPRVFVTNEYFTFGSPDYFSVAVKLADFDSDGDLDALMVNGRHWARQDLVFFNNGDGRFLTAAPLGEQASGYSPAVVDLNHDGKDDIVIARDRIVSQRFMGLGNGKFDTGRSVGRAGPTRAVVSADLDNDGEEIWFSLNVVLQAMSPLVLTSRRSLNLVIQNNMCGSPLPTLIATGIWILSLRTSEPKAAQST